MENIKDILWIISAVVGILVTGIGFLIPLVKNQKVKKTLIVANKIALFVQTACTEAEKFVNYTGAEKKAYVITQAKEYAVANNINFNEEQVSEMIEQFITLSKLINKREKDKEELE